MNNLKHICICICTYKRPRLLHRLLFLLQSLETNNLFDYSIVIVDNDYKSSAKKTIAHFENNSSLKLRYFVEPIQNIAIARNRAIANSKGDYVALIDDDEMPIKSWLLNLFTTIQHYECDGVLGPVLPYFEVNPPAWIHKGKFFQRPNHHTGHNLHWTQTRSGNALLRRHVFNGEESIFKPEYGSGGEDRNFFRRMINKGFKFKWCAESIVLESVPEERCKRAFMLKRALLRGQTPQYNRFDYILSFFAIIFYTPSLLILQLLGHHLFMKYLVKDFDHIGRLMTIFGVKIIKDRYVIG